MINKSFELTLVMLLICQFSMAQIIDLVYLNGDAEQLVYRNKTATSKGIKLDNGELVKYTNLSLISTNHFEAFDKIFRKADNRYPNLKIEFTGDKNAYSYQLEKLNKRGSAANVTRTAGGVMTILGVLSGDRGLTAAGVATGAAGQIAVQENNKRTSQTRSAMMNDVEKKPEESKVKDESKEKSEEELLREEFGDENVDGLIALIDKNHEKALAYANVGELSKDANYRLCAIWLKAMIAADNKDTLEAKNQYERLITFDPEIKEFEDAEREVELLLQEVESIRNEE